MDHPGRVDRDQRVGEPDRQPVEQASGERAALGHRLGQAAALDVFGGHPRAWAVGVGVDHRGDRHAAHPRGRGHLGAEPVAELGVVGEPRRGHLDRDRLVVRGEPEVDDAHAAGADPAL